MVLSFRQLTLCKLSNVVLYFSACFAGLGLLVLITSVTWLVVSAAAVPAKQLVVIDTDPGVDDAVALFATLGDPNIKVLGITCVRGNTDVPNVVINALKVLLVAKISDVPVYSGHNYGLLESPDSGDWFGEDGFGDLPFTDPPSPSNAEEEHAASFLARVVQEYPGEITVFALGPLTNIALALHLNPDFLTQVRRLVILGGSIRGQGNAAPGVEFNMYMDPASAGLVLERALLSNTTVTLVPMETCNENALTLDWRWNTLAKINNSVVSFLNELEWRQQEVHQATDYTPFDAFAAAVTLSPQSVTSSREYYSFVEAEARRLRGALALDYANTTLSRANVEIILEVNTTLIQNKLVENLSNFT